MAAGGGRELSPPAWCPHHLPRVDLSTAALAADKRPSPRQMQHSMRYPRSMQQSMEGRDRHGARRGAALVECDGVHG
ncbi:hypothetical protein GCM10025875_03510 [Litorihabitans aurantiacus]|uniref:Uncharacterized protein n=1 Tax=Litorihabitans aurantiacus TaxID=1930061 RepID=A0AA37XAR9_9MICO|nr:hypothetical protein GCM10025875_03510 [Litorihabitans aurantiacus]